MSEVRHNAASCGERGPLRHTIGEAAKILGVSQRSLRFYEEAGLIEPKVDSGSGYRYYTARDIIVFREYRELRGMGFSLDEAKKFMLKADFQSKSALLEAREAELNRDIDLKKAIVEWSREQRRRLKDVRSEVGDLSLRDCPAMVRVDFEYELHFTAADRDKALIKSLQDSSPLTFTSVRVARNAVVDPSLRCIFHRGLAFWERDAALIPVKVEAPLIRVPERQVIRLISRTVDVSKSAWIDDVNAFCAEEGLEVYDDILGAFYTGCRCGEKSERYYEFWVPVRVRA